MPEIFTTLKQWSFLAHHFPIYLTAMIGSEKAGFGFF